MPLPKFLLADHYQHPEAIWVIHTEYPKSIINLADDEVHWLEESLEQEDENDLSLQMLQLIEAASTFYDRQMQEYENDENTTN